MNYVIYLHKNKTMIIHRRTHYARPLQLIKKLLGIRHTTKRAMSAVVRFNSNCQYGVGKDQSDINKLFGFSLGMHHKNSIRVGWRWLNGNLELCSYIYENGVRLKEKVLCNCDFVREYKIDVHLVVVDGMYRVYFYVNGIMKHRQHLATKVKKYVSYPLSLYFGGNCTAPHDMTIDMNIEY